MSRRTTRAGALTLSLLLAGGWGLMGCSSDDQPDQDPGRVMESPTGTGEVPDPDALPDGYPEDEAPVIDGEIVAGDTGEAEGGGTSFSVLVSPTGPAADSLDEAVALLVAQGWTDNSSGQGPTRVLVKGEDTAVIEVVDDSDAGLVSYNLVTP